MLFGAAYYPEYRPHGRLEDDLKLMRDVGFTCVRMGESTWSTWEPEDGRFELDWMEPVLDALDAAGISAILGTPTYAIPAWLARKHPEVMGRRVGATVLPYKGRTVVTDIPYGARQNADLAAPAYRYHAERVIRRIIGRFSPHPAVVGYQVDNEPGIEFLDNDDVFHGFVDWLRHEHGTVDALNELWSLEYWSQRLSTWADLWRPAGNTNPGYDLAWRRYQAVIVSEFIAWQAAIVGEYAREDQFVTTCLVGGHGRPTADRVGITESLTVATDNVYVPTQDGLRLPEPTDETAWAPDWMAGGGVSRLHLLADMARSSKGSEFLVTETNAQAIGGHHHNLPAYDGQLRLIAHTLVARGARMISYWHWQTIDQGHEQYWMGVLGHDLEPGRTYAEVARIGAEFAAHDDVLSGLRADAEVALLYSQDSKYAFEAQPPLTVPEAPEADQASYQRIFDRFYRAFFDAGAQPGIVHPNQDFEGYPVVVAPALYVADDPLLERLLAYAQGGGHLVVTFRTGYADVHGRIRRVRAPGALRDAVGASYQEFANLPYPVDVRADEMAELSLPAGVTATAWADGLQLEGATPLLWYEHPHHGRFPAVTTHAWGQGSLTYVGTLPNPELGAALAAWVMSEAGVTPAWPDLPGSVRASTGRTAGGETFSLLANWSWQAVTIPSIVDGADLFTGAKVRRGEPFTIDPWDLRLLVAAPSGPQ